MNSKTPFYLPGCEPIEIQEYLEDFFADVDTDFPNKTILWSKWNHEKLDYSAKFLCDFLGYQRFIEFFYAYGYCVIFDTTTHHTEGFKPCNQEMQNTKIESDNVTFPIFSLIICVLAVMLTVHYTFEDAVSIADNVFVVLLLILYIKLTMQTATYITTQF